MSRILGYPVCRTLDLLGYRRVNHDGSSWCALERQFDLVFDAAASILSLATVFGHRWCVAIALFKRISHAWKCVFGFVWADYLVKRLSERLMLKFKRRCGKFCTRVSMRSLYESFNFWNSRKKLFIRLAVAYPSCKCNFFKIRNRKLFVIVGGIKCDLRDCFKMVSDVM